MLLLDVNVLIYAHRQDGVDFLKYREWLKTQSEKHPFGIADVILSRYLRILTHPRIFNPPTPPSIAWKSVEELRAHPHATMIVPGPGHWAIFRSLCESTDAKGNLVPDAYIAALAIEHGLELISTDRDYARFPGLKWRHPLKSTR
jgi:toxin-antitoxin system PIN domain toxin